MRDYKKEKNSSAELDFADVLYILKGKKWFILLTGILVGILVTGATILFLTPQYESVTKMYVLSKQDGNTITNQDMQTSLSLTKDYAELIKSRTVTESVIKQLSLDMEPEDLLKKITVDSASDTRILSVAVRDADPYLACKIADTLRETAALHIKNVMNIDAVNVVESANIPKEKVSPNLKKIAAASVLAGWLLSILFVLASYVMNDTIKSQEDAERYLNLSVLGMIPMEQKRKTLKSKRRGKNK